MAHDFKPLRNNGVYIASNAVYLLEKRPRNWTLNFWRTVACVLWLHRDRYVVIFGLWYGICGLSSWATHAYSVIRPMYPAESRLISWPLLTTRSELPQRLSPDLTQITSEGCPRANPWHIVPWESCHPNFNTFRKNTHTWPFTVCALSECWT